MADTLRMVGRKMKEKEVKEDDVDLAVSVSHFHCTVCFADWVIFDGQMAEAKEK